jgi:hypothetical protein
MIPENNLKIKPIEDVDASTSNLGGLAGILESILRRFRMASYLIALIPLYLLCILAMSIAATPGIFFYHFIAAKANALSPILFYAACAFGFVSGYFLYGLTLIFVVPLFNFLLPFKCKPFRGGYYSLSSVPWYFHNALTYIVRYTFLEFITPTPLNILFFRMMGMKIGKGVHINTSNISDPALIEIEDKVTIGGSYLIVEPVKIHKGVTIGLKATIMGDVEIGAGAVIAPHEVILPKSRVPAGRKPFIAEEQEKLIRKDLPSQDFI